jgi:hypothetical protein
MDYVVCPRCRCNVPVVFANTGTPFPCGGCGQPAVIEVFPAAARRAPAGSASGIVGEGTAACFFHDERVARAACDGCGRYLCALCDVPVGKEHLCPECLALRNRKGRKQSLPNERVAWDRLALGIALVPVLMWPFTIVTGPMALYMVIRYWRHPCSLVERAWPRFALAGLVAGIQTAAWTVGIVVAIAH